MADEGTTDGWRAQLPDDLKENEAFTGFEKIGDFANAYLKKGKTQTDLEGKLTNSVQLLKDDASDEDRATFFSKIGRPDKPEGYEFKKPDLPEGITYDENQEKEFRNTCHTLGLSKGQATGIYDNFHQYVIKSFQALDGKRKQIRNEAEIKLKADWGDKYTENVEISRRAAKALGGEEFITFMDQSGLGDNPIMVKTFHDIGTKILEDAILKGTPPGVSAGEEGVLSYPSMDKKE